MNNYFKISGHVYLKLSIGHAGGSVQGPWICGCCLRGAELLVQRRSAELRHRPCEATWGGVWVGKGRCPRTGPGPGTRVRGCSAGEGPRETRTWELRAEGRSRKEVTEGWTWGRQADESDGG